MTVGSGAFAYDEAFAPHDIALDARGAVYMGEVAIANSGGLAPREHVMLHKYVRA